MVISLLFGNFFATAIAATAGQAAKLDVTISALLVLLVEAISWTYYRFRPRRREAWLAENESSVAMPSLTSTDGVAPIGIDPGPMRSRSTLIESLNAFKLGMVYGLFVEAFKLGS